MEIIIGLLVVAAIAFYLIRKNKEVEAELQAKEEAPYKVEEPVLEAVAAPVNPQITDSVTVTDPVVTKAPSKKVAQPAQAKPKAPAKPRAPAKPKAVPAIKAAPAKKPRAK